MKDSHITLRWQETAPELHGAEAAAAITEAFMRLLSSREAAALDAGPSSTRAPAPAAAPVCDRSGDVGSRHYWPDGAQVGDWCNCGKRKKFLP